MFNIENAALVTHKACPDGSGCAVLFRFVGGLKENIFFTNPNHRDTDDLVNELLRSWSGPIIIADASISLEMAEMIDRFKKSDILLLDHHKSAIPLSKFVWCEIEKENNRCGSMMFYEWLEKQGHFVKPYKQLITYIDDYDRWVKNYPESDDNSLFHSTVGQDLYVERFSKSANSNLTPPEQYVVDLEKRKRNKYVEQKKKELVCQQIQVDGHMVNVGYVLCTDHQSILGNAICEDLELGVDIAVLVGASISLRASRGCPIDLSKVADLNGGGGHKTASGFNIRALLGMDLVDYVAQNMKWE